MCATAKLWISFHLWLRHDLDEFMASTAFVGWTNALIASSKLTALQSFGIWSLERRYCRTYLHVHHRGSLVLHGQHLDGGDGIYGSNSR